MFGLAKSHFSLNLILILHWIRIPRDDGMFIQTQVDDESDKNFADFLANIYIVYGHIYTK